MHSETLLVHGSYHPEKPGDGIVAPQIDATAFRHGDQGLSPENFSYTRHDNPNRKQLEETLAGLEKGTNAACFSSGMSATDAVLRSLPSGSHVIYPTDVYHGTRALLQHYASRGELSINEADMRKTQEIASLINPNTKLVWLETPSNPLLQITDIALVKSVLPADILLCTDNTWLSPLLQKPILLGSDIVVHSATKYLGGHSDLLGGVVVCKNSNSIFDNIRTHQQLSGAVLSSRDCHLLSRSLKTLAVRMRTHEENARQVAHFLNEHSEVTKVYYPGLEDHPGHEVAKKQSSGFGAMISFEVNGDAAKTLKVVQSSEIIIPATSLGGVESTWEHRKSSEGDASKTPDNLIRLSVGIEHIDDLLEDLEKALAG